MKSFILFVCVVVAASLGCSKHEGCTPVEPAAEAPQIMAFATLKGMTGEKDNVTGIYHEIVDSGTGKQPTINSTVSVSYVGTLLDGTKFDEVTDLVTFPLSMVIEGWQIGIPLIKEGGRIKLIIPSAYAYGCTGSNRGKVPIPPNAVLFFDVHLKHVQ